MLDTKPSSEQLLSSSAVSFARALVNAAEGKELFKDGFAFASAVSTYYSVFHLGGALILAYWLYPSPPGDRHASLRSELEKNWRKQNPRPLPNIQSHLADPASFIDHNDVPMFLKRERELPNIFACLGTRDQRGTLRDMREFASYAPRLLKYGGETKLYSGCQYEAPDFRSLLGDHLSRIDELFCSAVTWFRQEYSAIFSRIFSGDFVLFEFSELCSYHPPLVAARAWAIYRKICDCEHQDSTNYRPDPGTFFPNEAEEADRRRRYEQVVRSFVSG